MPTARDFARQALHDWGWLPATSADGRAAAEDVLLVVSELVTNACLHAEGPEELRIACTAKVLRVEVIDSGAGQPAPRTPHRAGRPAGTACLSCSGSAWTGGPAGDGPGRQDRLGGAGGPGVVPRPGFVPFGVRAARSPASGLRTVPRSGFASPRPGSAAVPRPVPGCTAPYCAPLKSAPDRRALCLPSTRPRAYLERPI